MTDAIFVLGAPRSGTTLLRRMLDSHSDVAGPHEFPLIASALNYFSRPTATSTDYLDKIYSSSAFRSWEIPRAEVEERLGDHDGARSVLRAIMGAYVDRRGATYYVDKNIGSLAILPQLLALFPRSKFVFIVRDGRDIAVSLKERGWRRYVLGRNPARYLRHLKGGALLWRDALRAVEAFQRCYQPMLLTLRYEDLVTHPDVELQRVCEFVGIQFESGMTTYHLYGDSTISEVSLRANHSHVTKPVTKARIGRFQSEIPTFQLGSLNDLLANDLRRYGYEVEDSQASRTFHSTYWIHASICMLLFVLKHAAAFTRPEPHVKQDGP